MRAKKNILSYERTTNVPSFVEDTCVNMSVTMNMNVESNIRIKVLDSWMESPIWRRMRVPVGHARSPGRACVRSAPKPSQVGSIGGHRGDA